MYLERSLNDLDFSISEQIRGKILTIESTFDNKIITIPIPKEAHFLYIDAFNTKEDFVANSEKCDVGLESMMGQQFCFYDKNNTLLSEIPQLKNIIATEYLMKTLEKYLPKIK